MSVAPNVIPFPAPSLPKQPGSPVAGALMMANRGFRVLRLKPGGKDPYGGGSNEATTDENTIWTWYEAEPKLNYGYCLGPDHVGIDTDLYKAGGAEAKARLGELPRTFMVGTPNGGEHRVHRISRQIGQQQPAPTIDIRHGNGYLVCPGSIVNGKPYVILDDGEITHVPPHIDARLGVKRETGDGLGPDWIAGESGKWGQISEALWTRIRSEGADRSAHCYRVLCDLFKLGLTDDEIQDAAREPGACFAAKFDDRGDLAEEIVRCRQRWESSKTLKPDDIFDPLAWTPPPATPGLLRISDLAGKMVPPREWHMRGFIPANNMTLLYGDGGTGKSLLTGQLLAATALGRKILSIDVEKPGPVLYVCAEDDVDEMHRRFAEIAESEGLRLEDLHDVHMYNLAGKDAVLGTVNRNELVEPTPLWRTVYELIMDLKPSLTGFDTLADVFAGNENSRTQARQFISQLRRPFIETRSSAILLAHPSLSGMASGTGTSGSTGWSNSVRSRLYLSRMKGEEGRELDPDARTLAVMKTNYGRPDLEIKVRWQNGVFVPYNQASPDGRETAADLSAEAIFLGLLRRYAADGRNVSSSRSASYAPTTFAKEPEARAGSISKLHFEGAMNRLFAKKKIRQEETGPPSKRRTRLIPAE